MDDETREILNKILRSLDDLKNDIHRVQETQEYHTGRFDQINHEISKFVAGKVIHAINKIEEHVGLPKTNWHE